MYKKILILLSKIIITLFGISLFVIIMIYLGKYMSQSERGLVRNSGVVEYTNVNLLNPGKKISISNSKFELKIDSSTGEMKLSEKNEDRTWTSNPENYKEDKNARGVNRTRLGSQIILTVSDKDGNISEINSLVASVNSEGLKVYEGNNLVLLEYVFPKELITIFIEYSLEDDGLRVKVPADKILENGDFLVLNVSVLPFFGASTYTDDGYMFVPDGSGALINFNNNKRQTTEYSQKVFGNDLMFVSENKLTNTQPVLIPAFGINYNSIDNTPSGGFLAIIENGAPLANIRANVSGNGTSYNNIYSSFSYRIYDEASVLSRTWAERKFYMVSKVPVKTDSFEVKYIFLQDGKSSYVDMAKVFSDWLVKGGMKYNTIPDKSLFIDLFCGVEKQKTILGFPYTSMQVLTEFEDIKNIISDLSVDNNRITARVLGFQSESVRKGEIDSTFDASYKLGGEKGLNNLIRYAGVNNTDIYFDLNIVQFKDSSRGGSTFFDTVKGVTNQTVLIPDYKLSTGIKDYESESYFLLRPEKVSAAYEMILNTIPQSIKPGLSLSDITSKSYSSYGNDDKDRNETISLFVNSLSKTPDDIRLAGKAANSYAYPFLDKIFALPVNSSNFDIFDTDIPFIHLALSGLLEYSTPAVNLSGSPDKMILKAIETGSSIYFELIKNDYEAIKDTKLERLYGSSYDMWKDYILESQKKIQYAESGIANYKIINHEIIDNDVIIVTYENGTRIIINYNEDSYTYDDLIISGNDFLRLDLVN